MAEETPVVKGELPESQTVNITGDEGAESEQKVAELSKKIAELEEGNQNLVHQNKVTGDEIASLKESLKQTGEENEDLKREIEKLGAENRSLLAVAARAAELEAETSRLQHDLISAMSDSQEANNEVAEWKKKANDLDNGEKQRLVELDAVKKERDLLVTKLASLEQEMSEKEKEIRSLERNIEEKKLLESDLEKARGVEKELLGKIEVLEVKLKVKEGMNGEMVGDGVANGNSGVIEESDRESVAVGGRNKASVVGGLQLDWPVVAASAVAAVAVAGLVCYLRTAKKM